MRLPNLEGYLKFPGPFPVASIRLKYTARPAAAERFVPSGDPVSTELPPAPVSVQGELALRPPPGEAGGAEPGAEPPVDGDAAGRGQTRKEGHAGADKAKTALGTAPGSDAATPAAAAPAPEQGPPDAGAEPEGAKRAGDTAGGRGSGWL